MMTAVDYVKTAMTEAMAGKWKERKTLALLVEQFNKKLTSQQEVNGWKLEVPCKKHQRRIQPKNFSLTKTKWALPANLGEANMYFDG
jgi:hypothetical protein